MTKFEKICKKICYRLRFVVLIAALFASATATAQKIQITGIATDVETKDPIPAVVVSVKSSTVMTATDDNGKFSISAAEGETLIFSILGYKTVEYKIPANVKLPLSMQLEADIASLEELVIEAGIIKREKTGFTGAYSTVTQEELKAVGNNNILQSLKSLDPAFVIVENNFAGANPNALPNIELRGQTRMNITTVQAESEAALNLPLFILDGFEASLQEINDLDINRVASVTLLKDAGSTAIYGSKGANGVIVIETVRPKSGQIFITYNGDYAIDMPDLSVYNMMNAEEKLRFERLAGRYNYTAGSDLDNPELAGMNQDKGTPSLQQVYYDRLAKVKSGVDTYWLSEPVRVALNHSHSVNLSGGEKSLQYFVGLTYKNQPGVMKGRQRDVYGGNIKLVYRGVDGLNIQNNISVTGTDASNGSWGSFNAFVTANPYYTKTNEDGTIPKYLDSSGSSTAINPLYNAMLSSRDDTNILNFVNNTSIDWTITKELKVTGSLSLRYSSTNNVSFRDPLDSAFDNDTYNKKGTYSSNYVKNTSYNANLAVNYVKSLDRHNFTLIGRGNIDDASGISESLVVVGFPEGSVGYPSQAYSYREGSIPGYSNTITRSMSLVGVFNYNFDYRYLFDFNYNLSGATNFGKNKRYQSFWSIGVGWNIHREPFAKNWKWLNELKLRGTYGYNGNQSGNYNTSSVYSYYVGSNIFGQSSYLSGVGNPDLKWQLVEKRSAGLDIGLLNNNLKFNFDIYQNNADPQIVSLAQKPSTGSGSFPINLGYLTTKGYEIKVAYNIINRPADKFLLSIRFTGGHNKGTYGGFLNSLNSLNSAYTSEGGAWRTSLNSLLRYQDGYSPTDQWVVQSLGIDPSNGREIFLTKDGRQTYDYNPDDRVLVFNTRPDIEGIIGFSFRYKKISFNTNLRYYVGAYRYNTDLFNRVENITSGNIIYNQDKRALYDRWQEIGQVSKFKGIQWVSTAEDTPVSSRFIQKDNYLRGESFKLSWDFTGDKWLQALKLKDLTLSVSMADYFNLYSIKIERGVTDPFKRSLVFNLSARF